MGSLEKTPKIDKISFDSIQDGFKNAYSNLHHEFIEAVFDRREEVEDVISELSHIENSIQQLKGGKLDNILDNDIKELRNFIDIPICDETREYINKIIPGILIPAISLEKTPKIDGVPFDLIQEKFCYAYTNLNKEFSKAIHGRRENIGNVITE